jgi:hypothetical protein
MSYLSDYSQIDPTLYSWAQNHKLHVFTVYKECEVRSVDVVSNSANRYQIWLDPPNEKNEISIHAWDYKKRKADIECSLSELENKLEEIYSMVLLWEGEQR